MSNRDIIEHYYRQHRDELLTFVGSRLGVKADAEDLVQDVFLRIADSNIPPKSDNYLMVAVRNACLNRIRQKQLHEKVKNLLFSLPRSKSSSPQQTMQQSLKISEQRLSATTDAASKSKSAIVSNMTFRYLSK